MTRHTPGNFVPLDINYARDASIRRAGPHAELLFVRSLAYAKGARSKGKVPKYDLPVVAVGLPKVPASIKALVAERLWIEVEDGWVIRSWGRWNAADESLTSELSEAGTWGSHIRWHVNAGVASPDCMHCPSEVQHNPPNSPPIAAGDSPANSKGREGKGSKRTPSSADADAAFESFWQKYPRKVGKQDARKVWDRKVKTTNPAEIASGLNAWLRVWTGKGTEPEFIPHPSTWLQRGSWEDDLTSHTTGHIASFWNEASA